MHYTSTITSKGTITIAAPIRRALGAKPGQKVRLSLDKRNQLMVDFGTNLADFEQLRAQLTKNTPNHGEALRGRALKEAAAKAWTADHND